MSNLAKTVEITTVEWRVVDIFQDAEDENFKCFVSPTFSFADTTWRMLLAGKFLSSPESTSLILMRNEHRNTALEYTFCLKKYDGTFESLDNAIMQEDQKRSEHRFIKLSEVLLRKHEMAPHNVLTLTCTLKLEPFVNYMSRKRKVKKLKKLDTLSQDFRELYTSKLYWDIVIQVKNKEFQAHTAVLVARSKVFAAMFQHDTEEKESGIIKIPDCDPDSFEEFLEFIYSGALQEMTGPKALNLFVTAEKYGVLELKNFCCEHLIENMTVDIWCDTFVMAELYCEDALFDACQKFFNRNLNRIFQTSDWENLLRENPVLANKLLKEMPFVAVPEYE